jgi:hypothetical protein
MATAALVRIRRRVEQSGRPNKAPESDWAWARARRLTVVVGVLSLTGTLLGFGTARAYDSLFGLSYGLWFETPLDLLILASDAVIGLVHAIWSGFAGPSLWVQTGTFSLAVTGLCAVPIAGRWTPSAQRRQKLRAWLVRSLQGLAEWLDAPQIGLAQNLGRAALLATLSFSAVWGSVLGVIGLFTLALCAVSFIPMVGTWGATAYARASIVEPSSCISPLPIRLDAKSTKVGAPCVAVRDPSTGDVVAGRLIFARGSKVFLYLKEEGRGLALTVKGASITSRSQDTSTSVGADSLQPKEKTNGTSLHDH